jgi:DNA invertase Pin-like site-specific DNA recombinase
MKPKRVALYVRVSTGEQNADLQVNELAEYAASASGRQPKPMPTK